jgi:hypothetical protein
MSDLQIRRELAKADPQAYLADVAQTLHNLGILYKSEGKEADATPVCDEAAAIFTKFSSGYPAGFSAQLAAQVCTR